MEFNFVWSFCHQVVTLFERVAKLSAQAVRR